MEKKDIGWVQKPFEPPTINLNDVRVSYCSDEIL